MGKKPKLLLLAGYFPPFYYCSGSVRPWNIAKYMSQKGWDVTVVTPHFSIINPIYVNDVNLVDTELKQLGIKRILTGYRWRFFAPWRVIYHNKGIHWLIGGVLRRAANYLGINNWIGWIVEAEKACSYLKSTDVDVILASGAPFLSFRLAKHLSYRLHRPYILDYRDPWTSNPHQARSKPGVIREEKMLLKGSTAVIAVSPSFLESINKDCALEGKSYVITNGYDPEKMGIITPFAFDEWSIVYTGSILPPEGDISPFMAVLKQIKLVGMKGLPTWMFHYYGTSGEIVRDRAAKYGVLDKVVIHNPVPFEMSLSVTKGANLSLVIAAISEKPTLEEKGIIPGKIYEVIGLNTPLLVISPPEGDVEEIVQTAGRGSCFVSTDTGGMVFYLTNMMTGKIIPPANHPEKYSWINLAEAFNLVLRRALHSTDQ